MRNSPFFEGVSQEDILIAGQPAKMPIFYYEGGALTALFPARYGALKRLVPDARFVPARLAPGIGVIGVSAFEYRDTDIGPYNELAISVPLVEPPFSLNLPGMALFAGLRRGMLHAYVHHLPVTTEIARAGGVDFYNYPKFIASIDFSDHEGNRECRLSEGKEWILTIKGKSMPAARSERMRVVSHTYMNRQPQSSEFEVQADGTGMSMSFGAAELQLGDRHPIATELNGLLFSRKSLYYQYTPEFEAILHGPDRLQLPLLGEIERARSELEGAK